MAEFGLKPDGKERMVVKLTSLWHAMHPGSHQPHEPSGTEVPLFDLTQQETELSRMDEVHRETLGPSAERSDRRNVDTRAGVVNFIQSSNSLWQHILLLQVRPSRCSSRLTDLTPVSSQWSWRALWKRFQKQIFESAKAA